MSIVGHNVTRGSEFLTVHIGQNVWVGLTIIWPLVSRVHNLGALDSFKRCVQCLDLCGWDKNTFQSPNSLYCSSDKAKHNVYNIIKLQGVL